LEVVRGLEKLYHSSLGLLLHSWRFPPSPFGVGEKDGLRLGDGDVKGRHNCSMEWLLRTLGEGFHLLFNFHFCPISSICKP